MTPERWEQIDRLFHAAIEVEPGDRAAFLADACADDEALRTEVESLLSAHTTDNSFFETSAADVAAELFVRTLAFNPGQKIGNYRILRHLGSGGMGEVYLADDTRLNRKVALKLLPPHFTISPERVRRFEREARTASALNHPNIVTIYEIGQSNGAHFIVTEFIDGKTLRQLINEKPFTLSESLNVAIQVASALMGAHAAGIIHRDIKPENIMIRADGYVKILDFGLAKLTEPQIAESDLETPTLLQSNPGLVMGTVQYMSPEQARGKKVDARTDIWSLGIVLYELLAGRVPFTGETPSHVMVSLMEDELPPLTNYADVAPKLDRIVSKSLRKNQKERYLTANHLAHDLKQLKRALQLDEHLKGALKAVPRKEIAVPATSRESGIPTETIQFQSSRRTSGAQHLAKTFSPSKKFWTVATAGLVIVVGLMFGALKLIRWNRAPAVPPPPFRARDLVRLTNTGRVTDAAISPDGRYVAYVAENGGKQSVWLKEVTTPNTREIVPPAERQYYGGTFSRDSNHVYYIAKEHNNTIGVLHRVPVGGGDSVKISVDVDGPVSFSPDGKHFVFVRGSSAGERALIIANVDGSNERKLVARTGYDAFSFGGPAWSPDGDRIASGAAFNDAGGSYLTIVTVKVSNGLVAPLTPQRWKRIGRIAWLEDGSGMVFNAFDQSRGSTSQLWYVSYPNGEAQRITADVQDYDQVTVTHDAARLIARQTQIISSLWIAPNNDANRARQILSHNEDDASYYYFRTRFSWMSDGNIIYTSLVDGIPNIWVTTAQGTDNRQLTSNPNGNSSPTMTHDGRYIIFVSDRTGFPNIWRMNSDGSNEVQLTKGEDDSWAWCSPDSRWVVYHSGKQGRRTLWRVPIDGGEPEQLTDYPSTCPVVAPDGKWISAYYRPAIKAPWQLAIIPFDGGAPVKSFDIPSNVLFQSLVRWTPDGLGLAYIANRDGVSNIWRQPVNGGPARPLTDFKSDQIFWFDWSPDGNQLGVTRGTVTSDAVLIKDLNNVTPGG